MKKVFFKSFKEWLSFFDFKSVSKNYVCDLWFVKCMDDLQVSERFEKCPDDMHSIHIIWKESGWSAKCLDDLESVCMIWKMSRWSIDVLSIFSQTKIQILSLIGHNSNWVFYALMSQTWKCRYLHALSRKFLSGKSCYPKVFAVSDCDWGQI